MIWHFNHTSNVCLKILISFSSYTGWLLSRCQRSLASNIELFKTLCCTKCPTRYRTRHFFNNFTTNEDIALKFEADSPHCVRNVKEKNVLLFKFRCNIFIGVRIINEMLSLVASGTFCINAILWKRELTLYGYTRINPLNAELNPVCHLLALLESHHILHISRIRVKVLPLRKHDWDAPRR
jgi:hypothetical protein